MPIKRLTPSERDRIIELKLARVPVRAICNEVGVTSNTVHNHWHKYLQETAASRMGRLEEQRSEAIARLEQIATDARLGVVRARSAEKHQDVARYLNAEHAAVMSIAKLLGLDVIQVNVTGHVTTEHLERTPEHEAEVARVLQLVRSA